MAELVTIQKAAELSGLTPKTLRFYEDAGLIPAPARSAAGYRLFSTSDVRRLRLVRRAKILGLPLAEIKDLADLAFRDSCGSFEERLEELVTQRLEDVERTISELTSLREELTELQATLTEEERCGKTCNADDCEHCRFIDD
ncbi:MAG: MerR family DNA-binding transcriptional regulator [Dehalococcoidia bacterium]|nr:MerR family DNA-binding transcriptional regulator [Dehalococcoidia bacterium]